MTPEFYQQTSKNPQINFMKICPVGEVCSVQTDRQTGWHDEGNSHILQFCKHVYKAFQEP